MNQSPKTVSIRKEGHAGTMVLAASLLLMACSDDGGSSPSNESPRDAAVVVATRDAEQTAPTDAAGPSPDANGLDAGGQSVGDAATNVGRDAGDAAMTARDAMTDAADAADAGSDGGDAGASAVSGPCDIYASGNTPCVAAHSTVRALYGAYKDRLYQVRRASDQTTQDIAVLSPGGFANAALQDSFCAGTTCTIAILYDQSPKGNHLRKAPAGGNGSADNEANAAALKLRVGGHSVYAIRIDAGMGYRNNKTSGVATGDQPEGEYMVTSGKHFNAGCCFDYGNAETSNNDDGNGTMEAIYFGNSTAWGKGAGAGPWVMADLENGLFAGQSLAANPNNTPLNYDYVSALIKGKQGGFALRGGNAQTGALKTMYEGGRPTSPGYNPMKKQGAIILGIGGDNSKTAVGSFFEGAMTSGYPTDATENAVQANIVAAGYGR